MQPEPMPFDREEPADMLDELIAAQARGDQWTETAILRALCRVPAKAGRQHSKKPLHMRVLGNIAFGSTDCWHWLGRTNQAGYGRMSYEGVEQPAHRLSYMAFVGPVPDGMFVLHKCDNPSCVNPDHLFLGDHADNRRDCLAKGRWSCLAKRGHENACAVHTAGDLDRMKDLRRAGYAYAVIAQHLGLGTMVVWNAMNRWKQ